jgi:hypothetical protein
MTHPMHLMIPFAGVLSEAGRHACQSLALPQLERLLARMTPCDRVDGSELSMSPPHEIALARTYGWPAEDGRLPWAAHRAAGDGVPVGTDAWALLTPVHLHVGTEQVSLADPASLALDADESRELFEIVRGLFESEGLAMHWGAPLRWYASHAVFATLPTAALDRVIGRNIDAWLPDSPQARLLRRLQSEVQMLLYTHEVNARREAAGRLAVNSFWMSGCGLAPPRPAGPEPVVDDRLRTPALSEDWAAWAEAWHALDTGPLAALLGESEDSTLTLCGERAAQSFRRAEPSLRQRWRNAFGRTPAHAVLEAL